MKKSTFWKRLWNTVLIILLCVLVLLLTGGLMLGIYVASITEREIDQTVFEVLSNNTASKI